MKKASFLLTALLFSIAANAQIFATTSAGQKVILNMNGTWKFASEKDYEAPCAKSGLGNLTVKNNTNNDIYFYYYLNVGVEKIKVKANTTKTIFDLQCYEYFSGERTNPRYYSWIVSFELFEKVYSTSDVRGFESGSFNVPECSERVLIIDN